jgi:hypothetical protein
LTLPVMHINDHVNLRAWTESSPAMTARVMTSSPI